MNSVRPALFALPYSRLLLAALTASSTAHAVDSAASSTNSSPTHEPVVMDRQVITGTPLGRTLFDLATPASVLSDRELAVRLQSTLGETVNTLPGVNSTSFGPNVSRPVIRGLDGDHIRILENGVGLIDASATSVDHAVGTDPLTIRRIELVRGPAALLYGSTAVGGVVNVINNRIPDQRMGAPITGSFEGRYESVSNLRSGGGLIEGGHQGLTYHFDGFTRAADELRIPGFARSEQLRTLDPLPPGKAEANGHLPNSAGQSDGGATGLSYVWDKGYVGGSVSGFNNNYGTVAEEDVTIRLHQRRVDLAGEFIAPNDQINKVTYKLGLSDYRHTEYEGPAPGTVFTNRGYDGRVELLHAPLGRFEGAVGFESQRSDFSALGDEAFLPKTTSLGNSAFVFEEINFDPVRLQFGGRFDYQTVDAEENPKFGPAAARDFTTESGSAGAVYTFLQDYAAALSVAYTQRAPNYQELFAKGPHLATAAFEVGNRALGIEHSVSIDFSLRKRAGRVTGSLGGFYNRFDKFITLKPNGQTAPQFKVPIYDYLGLPADFYGTEAEAVFHLLETELNKLHFNARFDWLAARIRNTGEPLPRISPIRFGGGLTYDHGPFETRIEVLRYQSQNHVSVGELPTHGYTMLNFSVTYHIKFCRVDFDLVGRGVNLLDEEARNHVSFLKDIAPQSGRGASLSLRTSF
jgi:iron complex outermembrane receptor protein